MKKSKISDILKNMYTYSLKFFKSNIYVGYTIVFVIISISICILFNYLGKSFINYSGDGFIQHFSSYVYLGNFYKEIVKNILRLQPLKMFDFSVGSGFDVLTTLNYYGYGDPLSVFMVLFNNSVEGYNLIALFRLYLAGITFIYFSMIKEKNTDFKYRLLAGISYAFSGFALQSFRTHSYFNNALILLPLVLAGIEKYNKENKKNILVISVALSFITNFYFAYMISLIAIFYELFKICFEIKEERFKNIFLKKLRLALVYLEGILLSSIILFPIVDSFLNNARSVKEIIGYTDSLIFYNVSYYKELIKSIVFTRREISMWSVLSFGGFISSSIILLFSNKEHKKYKIVFLLTMIGLLIPIVGKIFNGFSYVTNRWCFCIPLVTSYIFMKMLPKLVFLEKNDFKKIITCFGCFFILIVLIYAKDSIINKEIIYNIVINFIILLAVIISFKLTQFINFKYGATVANNIFSIIFIISIIATINVSYIPNKNYFAKSDIMNEIIKDSFDTEIIKKDNEFFRIEKKVNNMPNFSLISGEYSNSYYYSLIHNNTVDYYNSLGCSTLKLKHRLDSLDDRTTLLTLASVKYYIGTDESIIPYGFKKIENNDNKYYVYENINFLPLGYMYNNAMKREEFDKLSALEKEQALVQAIVLEKDINPKYTDKNIDYNIEYDDIQSNIDNEKIQFYKNEIVINEKNEKLSFSFKGKENVENYLVIENPIWNSEKSEVYVTVEIGNKQKRFFLRSDNDNFYFNKKEIVINLGYYEDKIDTISISFNENGKLSFSSIKIAYRDMEIFEKNIQSIKQNVLKNIKIENNVVRGNITSNQNGILQLSIPYSKGWKIFVDGKEQEALQTNIMYMGIELSEGYHEIELIYETPYIKLGAWVSCIMIIILGLEYVIKRGLKNGRIKKVGEKI